jgi:hypothetical protein
VGFGTNWFDVDNDTDLDLFVANGHIIDNIALFREGVAGSALSDRTYPQPNHLYINDGTGRFDEVHDRAGPGLELVKVSRGSAVADMDNDGDLDVLVTNNNQAADYLRNDTPAQSWIQLTLVGRSANRSAVGARVEITPTPDPAATSAAPVLVREIAAGASYASTNDIRLHVGLADAEIATIRIAWPDGTLDILRDLATNRHYLVHQGRGVSGSRSAGIH